MIKADNNENKLDTKTINGLAKQLGIDPNEEEIPKEESKPKAKVATRSPKKKIEKGPTSKIPTLSEFEEEKNFKNSDEYKEALNDEEKLKNELKDPEVIEDLLKTTSLTDLDSIVIEEDDDEEFSDIDAESLNFLLNSRPTYQVVLNQSAYIAHMEGLRYSDVLSVNHSTASRYEESLRRYQVYFDKINTNSIGLSSFSDFAKNTSMFDVNTIAFGIFNQTFPGDTEFSITCRSCKKLLKDVKISNDQLISVRDDDTYEQLDRVINSVSDIKEARKYSITNKTERIKLPSSSIIVDIKIPTIEDHLSLLREIRESKSSEAEEYETYLLFVKRLLVPNLAKLKKTGKLTYRQLEKRSDVLNFVRKMNLDDTRRVLTAISEKNDKYEIQYKIKSFPCTNCGEELGEITIDPEDILFQQALLRTFR